VRAALHGREVAEALQLSPEYDPQPLAGGTPAMARPEVLAAVQARLRERLQRGAAEIEAIAARLGKRVGLPQGEEAVFGERPRVRSGAMTLTVHFMAGSLRPGRRGTTL